MFVWQHWLVLASIAPRVHHMSSWENWNPSWAAAEDRSWSTDDPDFDYSSIDAETAGRELVSMLVMLKVMGVLSAKQTCILAWWAAKAGAVGECVQVGLRPDQNSGKYSKHFDSWSGAGASSLDLYQLPLGRRLRFEAARTFTALPVRVPHEALGEELLQCGDAKVELETAIRTKDLPKRYFEHQAVRSAPAGTLVHPLCIHIDAVPFTRSDSILGITIYFLLTERRHLVFSIRKSEVCSCGCRGWCSLAPAFACLAWSSRRAESRLSTRRRISSPRSREPHIVLSCPPLSGPLQL